MKYIFILFFALLFSKADAQNLQFSQVLTYAGQIQTWDGGSNLSPTWVVPEGKVWKVESYAMSYLFVNNVNITSNTNQGIIWLKAGDSIKYGSTTMSIPSPGYSYFLSIIEFNVVP